MRKIILFFLFSVSLYAQKIETETINLSKSIKDSKNSIRTFTVIDQRPNKEIGNVMYHKNQVNIAFENDAATDIKEWFYEDNKVRGKEDLVLLLENIEISEDKKEKYSIGKLAFKASTFIKKEDGYHFLYRMDTVATVSSRTTPYLAQSLAKKITIGLMDLLKSSYKSDSWSYAIPENELTNYASLIKNNLELYKGSGLKEGAYKNFYRFFTQSPESGYNLITNEKGYVTKAVKGEEKIPLRQMYAYIFNGEAYKITPVGPIKIEKDEEGYFIFASRAELFPEYMGSGAMIGSMAGGLVGGLVGAVIDASIKKNRKANNPDLPKVYLNPFTGNYIFPEEEYKIK